MTVKTIDFENTEIAYKLKSNRELRLAKLLFGVLQSPGLSSLGRSLLKFSIQAKLPVKGLVKATLFKQFIGGTGIKDTQKLMQHLNAHRVGSILDYSIEGVATESEFDKAVDEFLANVEVASKNECIPFSVFKPSAIATHQILEKISSKAPLTEAEKSEFEKVRQRFYTIFERAAALGVRVMIDAEESWIQQAIDDLALEMMRKFNTEKVIALNTYQMYRHDRLALLKNTFDLATQEGFKVGVKLVRGAYMEKERERALEKNYPSPINSDKDSTDREFNQAVALSLSKIADCVVFIGTHNENSVQLAVNNIDQLNLAKADDRIWFSQLYGMCDYVSFNLGAAGYNVAKYIPYGPINAVIPYLIRRADENSSVSGQAAKELNLISKELRRR